jgi:hypothetical protein
MAKERGYGVPRADIERAMSHYGISKSEYTAHQEDYPLPERGTGLTEGKAAGAGAGLGLLLVIGLILYALGKR